MEGKRMGRPTLNPKDISMKVRFDKNTYEKLERYSKKMGISKAELLRQGVHKIITD